MENQSLSAKEAYEQKREEKFKERGDVDGGSSWKRRALWIIVAIAVIAGIGWWIIGLSPKGSDYSVSFADLGREHIPTDSPRPAYNSNPPTSGPHFAEWAYEMFYDKEIPDGHLVHNLEHGDIWISFKPTVPVEVKKALESYAGGKVVVTMRSQNDTDIALAAWTRLDAFNLENGTLNEERIEDFIKRYQNRGPEKMMGVSVDGKKF